MYRKFLLFGLMFSCSFMNSWAQTLLKGTVYSAENEPIPYAHIGIPDAGIGTASFEDGRFQLNVPDKFLKDTLVFSALGFETKKVAIGALMEGNPVTIQLKPIAISMGEIEIRADQVDEKALFEIKKGAFSYGKSITDTDGGAEVAVRVQLSDRIDISEVVLGIFKNELDTFKVRCKIYQTDEKGMPGEQLLKHSIVEESSITKGEIAFDLSKISLPDLSDFYLGFEWIFDQEYVESLKKNVIPWEDLNIDFSAYDGMKKMLVNGKLVRIYDEAGSIVKEIKLNRVQRNLIQSTISAPPLTYFAMATKETSLFRVRSFAQWIPIQRQPVIKIRGFVID